MTPTTDSGYVLLLRFSFDVHVEKTAYALLNISNLSTQLNKK